MFRKNWMTIIFKAKTREGYSLKILAELYKAIFLFQLQNQISIMK
jgi:hypothetical protein